MRLIHGNRWVNVALWTLVAACTVIVSLRVGFVKGGRSNVWTGSWVNVVIVLTVPLLLWARGSRKVSEQQGGSPDPGAERPPSEGQRLR